MSIDTRSFRIIRSLGVASVVLCSMTLVAEAQAERYVPRPDWNRDRGGRLVEVEVQVDGHQAPLYRAPNGEDRLYFEAERGENYALRIRNLTGRRIGILLSVDGLNAVNGERSSLSRHEPMYVLDPWERTTIRGWRTSLEHVREFVFVNEERSYATRTGQANGDMGWIRVLAFEENRPIAWRNRDRDRTRERDDWSRGLPAPGAAQKVEPPSDGVSKAQPRTMEESQARRESFPGTGWGDRRRDPVSETWFDPASRASEQIVLRYEYARGLEALGIVRDWARLDRRERGEFGFARPPRR